MSVLPLIYNVGTILVLFLAVSPSRMLCQQPRQPSQESVPATTSETVPRRAGSVVFRETGCAHCHGEAAGGTEKGPSLLGIGRTWSRERLEHQVKQGGVAMPAFGAILDDTDIQSLLDYLESTKTPVKKPGKRTKN